MRIRGSEPGDREQLIDLVRKFRTSLANFSSNVSVPALEQATEELDEYRAKDYPVFVAEAGQRRLVGYLVCRVDGKTVWAESMFVLSEYRRQGIGSELFSQAERLADELGSRTVYNWVHPENKAILSFMKRHGYDVLNLVELRRAGPGEKAVRRITVGSEEFRY